MWPFEGQRHHLLAQITCPGPPAAYARGEALRTPAHDTAPVLVLLEPGSL